jgi:L-alanine-DL-glutamate epimerase-like enolase superfamily enzyme
MYACAVIWHGKGGLVQISHVKVVPVELDLSLPYRTATLVDEIVRITCVFVRIETRGGVVAWGCAAFDPARTGESIEQVTRVCHDCADRALDLNPLNTEYALAELAALTEGTPSARCAYDMAFYDLLGLAAGLPLYRLLGGYRSRIQTSITLSLAPVKETVESARDRAAQGFRILKLKGGLDPDEDVRRVQAVHDALPNLILRLDADQGYSILQALDVARALEGTLEMLEQPTPASDLQALSEVTQHSPIPILADESLTGLCPAAGQPASRAWFEHQAGDLRWVALRAPGRRHCPRRWDSHHGRLHQRASPADRRWFGPRPEQSERPLR